MSFLAPTPKGLHAVIPADPPPSKREKVAKYLRTKKAQFDQYQRLLQAQQKELLSKQQLDQEQQRKHSSSSRPNSSFYRLLSSTSFSSFARAQQESPLPPPPQQFARDIEEAPSLDAKNGEKLILFPSYARRLENGLVEIDIRGWVYAPGTQNRTNRLFTSVVRQIAGMTTEEEEDSESKGTDPKDEAGPSAGRSLPSKYSSKRQTDPRSSSPETSAVKIPRSSSRRSLSNPSRPRVGAISPYSSSPTSPVSSNFGTPPNLSSSLAAARNPSSFAQRRDVYSSSTSQARRLGVESSSTLSPAPNERQPLLNPGNAHGRIGSRNNQGYLISFSDDEESSEEDDYSDSSDEDEIVDNHHETRVVERRMPPVRSNTSAVKAFKVDNTNLKKSQSFYTLGNSESNSQLVAANATGGPLAASPINTSMNAYFANFKSSGLVGVGVGSTTNLGFKVGNNLSSSNITSKKTTPLSQTVQPSLIASTQESNPPLPPRPALISFSSIYNADKALQERIAPFISQPVAREIVTIQVGSTATENYSTYNVITTDSGHFGVRLRLNYDPAILVVECGENLVSLEEVKIVEPYGVSLISDIDDTVKHTGITGKRLSCNKDL